jgi:hypothetical protein
MKPPPAPTTATAVPPRRHCQIHRKRNELVSEIVESSDSSCLVDASLLLPDPERFGARPSIASRRHAVTPGLKVTVDDAVG